MSGAGEDPSQGQLRNDGPSAQEASSEGANDASRIGHTVRSEVMEARSCRGCLYFSRTLKDAGRPPLCVGLTAPEAVPGRVFRHAGGELSSTEKQQKLLEDFRYACIGYSLYPTSGAASAAASAPSASAASSGPPPASPPASTSSSHLVSPTDLPGPSQEASCAMQQSGVAVGGESPAVGVTGAPTAVLLAPPSPPSPPSWRKEGSVPGGSVSPEEADRRARVSAALPHSRGTMLPMCIGVEILAGKPAHQAQHQRQHQRAEQQGPGKALPEMPTALEGRQQQQQQEEGQLADQSAEGEGATEERLREHTHFPAKSGSAPRTEGHSPGSLLPGGVSAEEFWQRYMRSAGLIAKRCVTNFERLKGSIRSTFQDLFGGERDRP